MSRFQWFIFVTTQLNSLGPMILLLSLSFLTKVPDEYFCVYYQDQPEPLSCKPKDFCAPDSVVISFRPNMDLPDSYYNWILRYDLHCASGMKIGLIGASTFIGWIITLTFVPRLSDTTFGRQKMMVFSYIATLVTFTVLMFSTSYTLLIACIFVYGLLATPRVNVTMIYLFETFTREQYRYL